MHKDLKKIAKALEAQGFEVEETKRGHLMVFRDGRLVATFAGTPSDWRSLKNGLAKLKRAGFDWPPKR
jgi:hypothetical protein